MQWIFKCFVSLLKMQMSKRFGWNFLSFSLDFLGSRVLICFWYLSVLFVLVDDLLSICVCGFNFSFRIDIS